jgi:hypothetical protein
MNKSLFTLSDDTEQFEAYTNGSSWNGWACPHFTREQISAWLDSTPYDYRFLESNTPMNDREYPVLVIYFEDEETIESSPICIRKDNGILEILEGYCLEGYEFMEVEK